MLVMEHLVIVQARGEQVVGSLKGRLACILHAGLRKGYQVISLLTCCLLHNRELLEVKLRIVAFPILKTKENKIKPTRFGSTCSQLPTESIFETQN